MNRPRRAGVASEHPPVRRIGLVAAHSKPEAQELGVEVSAWVAGRG
jgi:hypothetical protein